MMYKGEHLCTCVCLCAEGAEGGSEAVEPLRGPGCRSSPPQQASASHTLWPLAF